MKPASLEDDMLFHNPFVMEPASLEDDMHEFDEARFSCLHQAALTFH